MTIRVATWNVQGMAPGWRRRRGDLVREIAAGGPDVVALQECAYRFRHQSAQLGSALGMRALRTGTLGMITGLPVTAVRNGALPAPSRKGSKRVLRASLRARDVTIHVWTVHLPLDAPARLQSAQGLTTWAEDIPSREPVVLAGDFNEDAHRPAVTFLREHGWTDAWIATRGEEPGRTWPADALRARADYVFVRGPARPVAASLIGETIAASDHFGVVVELALEGSG